MASLTCSTLLISAVFLFSACSPSTSGSLANSPDAAPIAQPQPPPVPVHENQLILFFEKRVKNDPDDFIAHNKLAAAYLEQMRATGDITYLTLAINAARASLAVMPPQRNQAGLAALAAAEYAAHQFASSRDNALRLIEIDPNKGYAYNLLGDALLELGEYDAAAAAFKKMDELGGITLTTQAAMEQRLSRISALYGDTKKARFHMQNALRIAQKPPGSTPDTIAWCQWQLGRMSFAEGGYRDAEKNYQAALATLPNYFGALASLGQLRAATGDLAGAIDHLGKATSLRPDPGTIAMLGDVYKMAGREGDATRQYALIEEIARLSASKGDIYSRELAMFYANHDVKPAEACEATKKEYETRRDIYGADALAWTCYKAGRMDEAKAAMRDALRLGTKDAQLFYHAGMIEKAAGNKTEAKRLLAAALKLNPSFDLLQSENARTALRELEMK